MKPPIAVSMSALLIAGATTVLSGISANADPGSGTKFSCGTSQGYPATVVQTSRGTIPIIRWVSRNAFGGDYRPEYRCQVVSSKFQQFYKDGKLNYLTTGFANGQPVVCVAGTKGGPCAGVLFTLKSGVDPWETLTRLMNVRVQAGAPLNESTSSASPIVSERYINVNDFLETAPTDSASRLEVTPDHSGPALTTPAKGMW